MKLIQAALLIGLFFFLSHSANSPFWDSIPSLRAGQIESVTSLMTAQDTSTNITDITFTYYTPIPGSPSTAQLQYGLSLISYQSWMTETFSFNITMVTYNYAGATIRFTVLDNTFFTQAKVHYIVIWTSDPKNANNGYYNMQVIYGCYLTSNLLASPTNIDRNQAVGGLQTSSLASGLAYPYSNLVMKSMISGLQLSNSVGNNNYIKVTPSFLNNATIRYLVDVEANNLVTFFCVSTVIANPYVNNVTYLYNLEYNTYILTGTNTGLAAVPYSYRYDGADRMFFGISEFNLSMTETRYINVQTANISLVSTLYRTNAGLNKVTYNTFYFAMRTCTSPSSPPAYYDPTTFTCVDNSSLCVDSHPDGSPGYVCNPCHYSCQTCNLGTNANGCATCPATSSSFRSQSGSSCPCISGYADAGSTVCQTCNITLIGCLTCSSTTVCSTCDTTTYQLSGTTCICKSPYYMATGYCLTFPGCKVAGYYLNIIACLTCDTANNFVKVDSNFSCLCYQGYFFNSTANNTCYDICGDGIAAYGKCDDGNNITGDGCDSSCNVENGYYCTNNYTAPRVPGISVCVLKEDITVTYLYAERIINTNSFKMAFQVSPVLSGLTSTSFASNFNTSLPISSQKITCDPVAGIIYLQGVYQQDIEGTAQTASISFNNMSFYADSQSISFTAVGINAQLVIDQFATSNTIFQYIVMAEAVLALLLAIFASVVGLKLVGIELLIPMQLIYFTLATIESQRSYNFVLNNLKYSNGFSTILSYDYSRTYSQNKSLVGMNYETQFLLSTNIMLGAFIFVLFWLFIHHLRLKYKEYKLQVFLETNALTQQVQAHQNSADSEEDKQDLEEDEENMKLKKKKKRNHDSQLQKQESRLREDHHRSFKVFSFEVDRVYFIFYLILINQMMFGFIIMTLNVPISSFYFPQQINVLVCNFIFFIFIGNIVFISYDQESNKMIAFTCIKDRYAYIYLLIDFIIITTLSMCFQESFSAYLIAALTISFPILVAKEKPYGNAFMSLENMVAMYLQVMLFICQIIVILIGSSSSQQTSLVYSFVIIGLIGIGQILTIIRIGMKVNFKKAFDDLKNPHKTDDNDKKAKKIIEKNLDLLEEDKNVNVIPPASVKNDLIPKNTMVDWQSKNTEEYESIRQRQVEENEEIIENAPDHDDDGSDKGQQLNDLEILKKKLRNNLKMKRQQDMLKKAI